MPVDTEIFVIIWRQAYYMFLSKFDATNKFEDEGSNFLEYAKYTHEYRGLNLKHKFGL